MKLSFTPEAAKWLDRTVNRIKWVARQNNAEQMERTSTKMQYKFAGSPQVVFLTAKERQLVELAARTRLETLESQAFHDEELAVVRQIMEVLNNAS